MLTKSMTLLITIIALSGCASGPSVKNQSDIAQMADVGTTFTALELAEGFQEANPLVAPLTESYAGYGVLVGLKLGINYGFRRASPYTCTQGVRFMTSSGYALGVSNAILIAGGGPIGLAIGAGVGLWNWFKNDNFVRECQLEEKYPDHDIYAAWRQGLLFTEAGVPK